jgi:adenosylcobinamide kinase / adenosylcobinamide-phosphate guanylyltransferase
VTLVVLLGGARAGKSALAVELAARSHAPVAYIATAEGRDEEMAARIARHRAERPVGWTTVEEPVALREVVEALDENQAAIVDCLTLWVSNLLERGDEHETVVAEATAVADAAAARQAPVVVVTNEVGLGVVPTNELARRFRDLLGEVNRLFVGRADEASFVIAGKRIRLEDP